MPPADAAVGGAKDVRQSPVIAVEVPRQQLLGGRIDVVANELRDQRHVRLVRIAGNEAVVEPARAAGATKSPGYPRSFPYPA